MYLPGGGSLAAVPGPSTPLAAIADPITPELETFCLAIAIAPASAAAVPARRSYGAVNVVSLVAARRISSRGELGPGSEFSPWQACCRLWHGQIIKSARRKSPS